jgi:phage tail-like protein
MEITAKIKIVNGNSAWTEAALDQNNLAIKTSSKGIALKVTASQGIYTSKSIDSQIPGCLWHRVVVDANVPLSANAQISFVAAEEDKQETDSAAFQWSEPITLPADSIVVAPRGRYLWFKISMTAGSINGKTQIPAVKTVKLFYGSPSLINFLPEFYSQDNANKAFLENYLSVFETMLTNLESKIEDAPKLLDSEETPSEFLPWLSTWVGAAKDENWPEEKWRQFLKQAAILYRKRGTMDELKEIIHIYTGSYPYAIVERALLRASKNQFFEELLDKLFGDSYSFAVIMTADQVKTDVDQKVIKRIIESEKPAHTNGILVVLENQVLLDSHTYLGINTKITEAPPRMK